MTYSCACPRQSSVRGFERRIASQQRLEVAGERMYVELIARVTESMGGRPYCEDQIDRVVAQLAAILSPAMFAQEVWSGWLSDSEQALGDLWLMTAPSVDIDAAALQERIGRCDILSVNITRRG